MVSIVRVAMCRRASDNSSIGREHHGGTGCRSGTGQLCEQALQMGAGAATKLGSFN